MKKIDLVNLINEEITKIAEIVDKEGFIFISHLGIYADLLADGRIDKVQICYLIKARNWLRDVQATQMMEYRRIWAQKTPASWAMGRALGMEEANEYKSLNRAIKELRKVLIKIGKPELFTKKIKKILKEAADGKKSKAKTKRISDKPGDKDDNRGNTGGTE
jgi:hypothetical protein